MSFQNAVYSFASPHSQRFTFPKDMMLKIAKNTNSIKVFEKLLKTCKWFFTKNPVIPAPSLIILIPLQNGWRQVLPENINLNSFYKLWITQKMDIKSKNPEFFISTLQPKIYRCDASIIFISLQIILFDNFKHFLGSSHLREFYLEKILLKHNDGNILVSLHEIYRILPSKVLKFTYVFEIRSICTINIKFREINDTDCKNYEIINIPENYNVARIYNALKKNPNISLSLKFENEISGEYKNRLQNFVQRVIKECENNPCINPPHLNFESQSKNGVFQLDLLRHKFKLARYVTSLNYLVDHPEEYTIFDNFINKTRQKFNLNYGMKVKYLKSLPIMDAANIINRDIKNIKAFREAFDLYLIVLFYLIAILFAFIENMWMRISRYLPHP